MGDEIAERPSRKRRLLAGWFVAATLAMGAGLIGAGGASADQGNAVDRTPTRRDRRLTGGSTATKSVPSQPRPRCSSKAHRDAAIAAASHGGHGWSPGPAVR